MWQWLARRRIGVGLFLALWLFVLCVPSLRLLLHMQVLGSSLLYWSGGISFSFYPDDLSTERLQEQFRNDWRVQAARLAGDKGEGTVYTSFVVPPAPPGTMQRITGKPRARKPVSVENDNAIQYHKWIESHPDKTWLLVMHLGENIVATFDGRIRDQNVSQRAK
jgi:hypothetical protein